MADGITYAGQPVLLDLEDHLKGWIAQRWPESRWPTHGSRLNRKISSSPWGSSDSDAFILPYDEAPAPQLNELIIPAGASRYARGLFMVDERSLLEISKVIWGSAGNVAPTADPWGTSQDAAAFSVEYNGQSFSWDLYALQPLPVRGEFSDGTGTNGLWLLPLVDYRYFLVREAFETTVPQNTTWAELFTMLANAAGVSGLSAPSVDSDYGEPDRSAFDQSGVSLGVAIDAAALSIGRRVVPVGGGKTLSLQSVAVADSTFSENVQMFAAASYLDVSPLASGNISAPIALPYECLVTARRAMDHAGTGELETSLGRVLESSDSAEVPTVYTPFWLEYFDSAVNATSATRFGALTSQIGADMLAWRKGAYSSQYASVLPYKLCGYDDYLSFRCSGSRSIYPLITHVVALRQDFRPVVSLNQSPGVYVHPHEVAVMTVYSEGVVTIHPADGPYNGANIEQVPAVTKTGAAVPIDDSVITAHYVNGDGWTKIDGGTGGGGGSGSGQIVAFTLTADMTLNPSLGYGTATATVDAYYGGTAPTEPITVHDVQGLYRHAKSSARGWARAGGNDVYAVIQCDQPALQIEATIAQSGTGDPYGLRPGEATGKIEAGYGPLTDQPFGQLLPNLDGVDLPNSLGLYAKVGDKAILQFDEGTGSYFFLQVTRPCMEIKGTTSASFVSTDPIPLSSVVGVDGVAPATTASVVNDFGWSGDAGLTCVARLNIYSGNYEARQLGCP